MGPLGCDPCWIVYHNVLVHGRIGMSYFGQRCPPLLFRLYMFLSGCDRFVFEQVVFPIFEECVERFCGLRIKHNCNIFLSVIKHLARER